MKVNLPFGVSKAGKQAQQISTQKNRKMPSEKREFFIILFYQDIMGLAMTYHSHFLHKINLRSPGRIIPLQEIIPAYFPSCQCNRGKEQKQREGAGADVPNALLSAFSLGI